jgi:SAM-dependent methyltransferase
MFTGYEWFWPEYSSYVEEVLKSGPNVLDVGTPQPFRKELRQVSLPQPEPRLWTLDYPGSRSADVSIFADAAHLPFKDDEFDGVLCKEVLEHVRNPIMSAAELVRVTKPGGKIFATLIYIHPYHPGDYGDYWRFTRDAARELFPAMSVRIKKAGGWAFVFRAYTRGRLIRILMTRAGTVFLNFMDEVLPAGNATLMHFVLAIKPN